MQGSLICRWHKCGHKFTPSDGRQLYCGPKCRVKRLEWAKTRGARIVNRLLDTNRKRVSDVALDEWLKLLEEVNGTRP